MENNLEKMGRGLKLCEVSLVLVRLLMVDFHLNQSIFFLAIIDIFIFL